MKKTLFILAGMLLTSASVSAQFVSLPSLKNESRTLAIGDSEGSLQVVLEEDFSLMTEGSDGNPAPEAIEDDNLSIPDKYTHTPGWQGYFLHQSGGSLYIGYDKNEIDCGAVNTPKVNVSRADGAFTVRFRAKSGVKGYEDRLYVSSKITASEHVTKEVKLTDQWQDYEVKFENGTRETYVLFYPYIECAYIDDIRLEVMIPFVAAPAGLSFSNYTGSGFTASWAPVNEATGYLFNVFSKAADGSRSYIIENMPLDAQTTSYTVKDLPATESYYFFSVRATDGIHNSPESVEVAVEGLLLPVLEAETEITTNGFTASWQPVAHAKSYHFIATREHVASEAGTYDFVNEDFADITGNEDSSFDYTSIPQLPGWTIASPRFLEGEIGVYSANGQYDTDAWIQSSIYDLSKNGGKVHVKMNAYCNHKKYTSDIILALYTYDPSVQRYRAADIHTYKAVGKDGILIDEILEGGGSQSLLYIEPDGYADMMIKDIQVSQDLETGDQFNATVVSQSTTEPTITVSNLDILPGDKVYYVIRAVGRNSIDTGNIYSDYTAPRYVKLLDSSVDGIGIDDTTDSFTVYNLQGIILLENASADELNTLPAGLYIVNGKKLIIR